MRIAWNKGKKLSDEHRKHLSEARRKVITKDYKGKVLKICEFCGKEYKVFQYVKNRSKLCSQQCKYNWMSSNFKREKHWRWKGGQKDYRHTQDRAYKEWRMAVFLRDNFTCQSCGARGYLQAHHIKGWIKYPDLRYDLNNGVSLCLPCHQLTPNYKGKKQ